MQAARTGASRRLWQRWHPVVQVPFPQFELGDGLHEPNDQQLRRAVPGRLGFHFFLALVSVVTRAAIFSFSSVQVLRTSAVTAEQFSISRKTRLASSR